MLFRSEYPRYQIKGRRLYWLPLPSTARTIEVWYRKLFDPIEDYADEIDPIIPRPWVRFLVAYLARYVLDKQETDSGIAEKLVQSSSARIVSQVTRRRGSHGLNTPRRGRSFNERVSQLPRWSHD